MAATEKGLAAQPDPETLGMLLMNKALILHRKGQKDEAVRMLGTLILDPASTLATEQLSKVALKSVLDTK